MIEQSLRDLGYEVVGRTSSKEALETFQAAPGKFDLVITDQTMPGMTGAELVKEILQLRPDTRIILCTGFSQISAEEAKALGVQEFLSKPIAAAHLASVVRDVLDRP